MTGWTIYREMMCERQHIGNAQDRETEIKNVRCRDCVRRDLCKGERKRQKGM